MALFVRTLHQTADIWQTNVLLAGDHNQMNATMVFENKDFIVSMHWTFGKISKVTGT
jgi:superfamily I DNA and/or RNA helicase